MEQIETTCGKSDRADASPRRLRSFLTLVLMGMVAGILMNVALASSPLELEGISGGVLTGLLMYWVS